MYEESNNNEQLADKFLSAARDFLSSKSNCDSRNLHLMANELLGSNFSIGKCSNNDLEPVKLCERVLNIQSQRFLKEEKAFSLAFIPVTFQFSPKQENKNIKHKINIESFNKFIREVCGQEALTYPYLIPCESLSDATPNSIQELLQAIVLDKGSKFFQDQEPLEGCFQQYLLPVAIPIPAHLMFDSVSIQHFGLDNSFALKKLFELHVKKADSDPILVYIGNIGDKDKVVEESFSTLDILHLKLVLQQFQEAIKIAKEDEDEDFKVLFHIKLNWALSDISPAIQVKLSLKDEEDEDVGIWERCIRPSSKNNWSDTLGLVLSIANHMKFKFLVVELVDPFTAYEEVMIDSTSQVIH